MAKLAEQINSLNKEIREKVDFRMGEFSSFKEKDEKDWFSELCFCILTANSRAKTAIAIQNELGFKGFANNSKEALSAAIKRNKHRFHNNKAAYIIEARKHLDIKDKISKLVEQQGEAEAREFLVKNIKGLGYKEASHFLRNTGHESLAILDRHILNLLKENEIIDEIPKTLSKAKYLDIEDKFNKIAFLIDLSPARLDLCMWYLKTGEVLK